MTPRDALLALIGGVPVDADRIAICGGLVYVGITGAVRLQQPGRVVVTLGAWGDGAEELAAAYWAAARVAVA